MPSWSVIHVVVSKKKKKKKKEKIVLQNISWRYNKIWQDITDNQIHYKYKTINRRQFSILRHIKSQL